MRREEDLRTQEESDWKVADSIPLADVYESLHSFSTSFYSGRVCLRAKTVPPVFFSASSDGYQVPNHVDYGGLMGQSTSTIVTEESRSSPTYRNRRSFQNSLECIY